MTNEEWKPIPHTDGRYEVSNYGHVRTNNQRPGLLTLTKQPKGYRYAMVTLSNGKLKNCRVHRLVAQMFLPNPEGLPEVNHKDGNKDNNHVDNLEWVTRSANVRHSWITGLSKPHGPSEDGRQRLHDLWAGKPKSESMKAKLSAALKGRKCPWVSERQKGRRLSQETIEKIKATKREKRKAMGKSD